MVLLGVVHTPVKSRLFPSKVFILRKMSALLQVDRAGDSESGLSGLRGSFLCGKSAGETGQINTAFKLKVKLGASPYLARLKKYLTVISGLN